MVLLGQTQRRKVTSKRFVEDADCSANNARILDLPVGAAGLVESNSRRSAMLRVRRREDDVAKTSLEQKGCAVDAIGSR